MADSLEEILGRLSAGGSVIERYRSNFATPVDIESLRFWLQHELNRIQAGFASVDDVVGVLAQAITGEGEPIPGPPGPEGPQGPPGPPGPGGRGKVYRQPTAPPGVEGDIWLKVRV